MAGRLLVSKGMQWLLRPVFRAHELHRKFGLRATIGLALKKLISPVARVGSVYLMECDLRVGLPAVEPVSGIIAREAFVEDISLIDGIRDDPKKNRNTIERFKRGDRWFVGIDSSTGKIVNCRWATTAWELIPELEHKIVPKPGEAFIYGLYTAPGYRRRGIDSFTRQYTYDLLYRTSGITTVLATIFAENTVSLKAGRKFLKKIGRIWYISMLGGRTRVFWWPNARMPRLVPASRTSRSSEQQVFG